MFKSAVFATTAVLLCSLLSGCMTDHARPFNPMLCNTADAYEAGYNDGMVPWRQMDSKFLDDCREDLRVPAQASYMKGFTKARKVLQKEQAEQMKEQEAAMKARAREDRYDREDPRYNDGENTGGAEISINFGGHPRRHRWYCKLNAFMNKFEGFGPTRFDARRDAFLKCRARYDRMFCKNAECRIIQ